MTVLRSGPNVLTCGFVADETVDRPLFRRPPRSVYTGRGSGGGTGSGKTAHSERLQAVLDRLQVPIGEDPVTRGPAYDRPSVLWLAGWTRELDFPSQLRSERSNRAGGVGAEPRWRWDFRPRLVDHAFRLTAKTRHAAITSLLPRPRASPRYRSGVGA